MTITERNRQLYDLRQMLDKKRAEIAWIEQNIWLVNETYDRENRPDLFTELFGDTPMADEVYGG